MGSAALLAGEPAGECGCLNCRRGRGLCRARRRPVWRQL